MEDLFLDLSHGRLLIHLLKIISGEKIEPIGLYVVYMCVFVCVFVYVSICLSVCLFVSASVCDKLLLHVVGCGRLRISKIENIDKALTFLTQEKKVRM